MWTLLLFALDAHAVDAALVHQRIAETQSLRSKRIARNAPAVPKSAYDGAAAGKVQTGLVTVEGHKSKQAWGVAVVPAPIGRYWAAINDDRGKIKWTKLDYAEVLAGSACQAPRRVFQFLPVPLITDRWWILNVQYNDTLATESGGRVREQMWSTNGDWSVPTASAKAYADQGMHVESTTGSWLLTDLDGKHTLVEYYTWSDPGGSVPAGLASSLAANGIDNTMEAMVGLSRETACPVW